MSCGCSSTVEAASPSRGYLLLGGKRKRKTNSKRKHVKKSHTKKLKQVKNRKRKSKKVKFIKGGATVLGDTVTHDIPFVAKLSGISTINSNLESQPIDKVGMNYII